MDTFKKIDLPIQIILLAICWLPLAISPWYIIYWMITMPILGFWQLLSVGLYAYKKQLNKWHKIYFKVLVVAVIVALVVSVASYFDIISTGVVLGFSMALFYMFVSYKTLKNTPKQV